MAGALIVFGILFMFVTIPGIMWWSDRLGRAYGPAEHLPGPPQVRGRIFHEGIRVPVLGVVGQVDLTLLLAWRGNELSGRCERGGFPTAEVFIRRSGPRIQGRMLSNGGKLRTCEGFLSAERAELRLGFAKGSLLDTFNAPYEFTLRDGTLVLTEANNGQSKLEKGTTLTFSEDRLSGGLLNRGGKTQINVEAEIGDVPRELVGLAILCLTEAVLHLNTSSS